MNQDKQIFLETAESIGSRLCKEAFWHDSQCNWIGRSVDDLVMDNAPPSNTALSSDVYEGTSGIAIFLTNLYLCKKEKKYQKAAEGAINQALSHIDTLLPISQFGFHSGALGIAYVAAKASVVFENPSLIEHALKIVKKIALNKNNEHLMDVISGNAGAISPLIHLHGITKDDDILNLALDLGDELLSAAVKESYGWSWDMRSNGINSSQNLTGFSHGAAGIGCALLELFSKTNKKEFRDAAEQAFLYENHWFSEKEKNWPDFRIDDKSNSSSSISPIENLHEFRYSIAWCHGAPGIGLARLRAIQILKDEIYLKDCLTSLHTIVKVIKGLNATTGRSANFSLCHGLAGLGDILVTATEILNDNIYLSIANEIGKYGIEKYAKQGYAWPCGIKSIEIPGLMLGLAGIGNFYLRLYHPTQISSPLIIIPSR